jgi:hypothetical protein
MLIIIALLSIVLGSFLSFAILSFIVSRVRRPIASTSTRSSVRAFSGKRETARRLRQLERGIIHLN